MSFYLILYICLLNLFSFVLMGVDKYKAKRNHWRISEQTLMLCALFGGSFGVLFGMTIFHHKTKKKKFVVGVPIILLLQCILLFYLV